MCDKVQYSSYKQAQSAIKILCVREKQSFRVYKCNECELYHLTSIPNKKLKKNKKERFVKKFGKIEANPIKLKVKKNIERSNSYTSKFIETTYKPFEYLKNKIL